MYQIYTTSNPAWSAIKRIADNAFIPMDQTNTDYQEYLKWLAEGNVPLPPSDSVDEVAGTLKETPDAS